jgi:SAM-dependent methyltransferase
MSEGRWFLIPVYYLLLTSDLAREGIENSGSYRFADHIYSNRPSGRFVLGTLLDAVLLNMKSARSMRLRYLLAKKEISGLLAERHDSQEIDILSVPCGLARELFESVAELERCEDPIRDHVRWTGMDLDADLVNALNRRADSATAAMNFCVGDALRAGEHWRHGGYDMIISTGFTEFLDDAHALAFYQIVHRYLKTGGLFVTSGMARHALSDYLLRSVAELYTHYRSGRELNALAQEAGFRELRAHQNELQTMIVARKEDA